jgi:hypothetical protein
VKSCICWKDMKNTVSRTKSLCNRKVGFMSSAHYTFLF